MCNAPRPFPRAVTVAALLLAFAPYAAQAEKRPDEQDMDHSNQDYCEPDDRPMAVPGEPGIWDGPKSHPDFGGGGAPLDPLRIGSLQYLPIGELPNWLDRYELLLPLVVAVDGDPIPVALPSRNERLIGWGPSLAASDGLLDLGLTNDGGFGPPPPIPEPGTLSLLVLGGALAAAMRRRRG